MELNFKSITGKCPKNSPNIWKLNNILAKNNPWIKEKNEREIIKQFKLDINENATYLNLYMLLR